MVLALVSLQNAIDGCVVGPAAWIGLAGVICIELLSQIFCEHFELIRFAVERKISVFAEQGVFYAGESFAGKGYRKYCGTGGKSLRKFKRVSAVEDILERTGKLVQHNPEGVQHLMFIQPPEPAGNSSGAKGVDGTCAIKARIDIQLRCGGYP